jgi:glycosyltransferase involved in cell wall biosynthesis
VDVCPVASRAARAPSGAENSGASLRQYDVCTRTEGPGDCHLLSNCFAGSAGEGAGLLDEQLKPPKLSVVMPVYNERRTIEEILCKVQAVAVDKEIIIVEDGSTDGTRDFLEELARSIDQQSGEMPLPTLGGTLRTGNIRVFFQPRNCGKGAALRRGFREARGEYVVVQDADLECDPEDFHHLLEPAERGIADVVYGSRFLGGSHRVLFFWHALGNKVLTLFSNVFSDLDLTDVWTCYKLFRRELLLEIDLKENRFGIEPEITAKVARKHWRVYEVPISYRGRTYAEGKKIGLKDGFRGIWCVVRYNLFE